jgi:hypothetical protein
LLLLFFLLLPCKRKAKHQYSLVWELNKSFQTITLVVNLTPHFLVKVDDDLIMRFGSYLVDYHIDKDYKKEKFVCVLSTVICDFPKKIDLKMHMDIQMLTDLITVRLVV